MTDWIACEFQMPEIPDPMDPKGIRSVVAYEPGVLREFIPYRVVDALWFVQHWQAMGYTHWAYLDRPVENNTTKKRAVHFCMSCVFCRVTQEGLFLRLLCGEDEERRQLPENLERPEWCPFLN